MSKITAPTLAHYTKAIAALIAAIATSLLTIFGEGDIAKTLTVIVAVAGVLSVYTFPNAGADEGVDLDFLAQDYE